MRTRLTSASARFPIVVLAVACFMAGSPAGAAVVNLSLEPIDAPSLDANVVSELPILLAAALESAKGYQMFLPSGAVNSPAIPARVGQLELHVTGKGPWKILARVVPATLGPSGRSRVIKARASLAGRDDLVRAVDELAASIHVGLAAIDALVGAAPRPSPIAQALTQSPQALQAWLDAMVSLRKGDAGSARSRLELALAADPGFIMANADLHYLLATGAEAAPFGGPPVKEDARRVVSPLAAELRRALGMLARGEAARAEQVGELLFREFPTLRWGRIVRALALTAMKRREETATDWELVASADPSDPRVWNWLGRARLASGDLSGASAALRRAREVWPSRLDSWTLEAEARVRARDLAGARETLEAMSAWMKSLGIAPSSDDTDPGLMLGAVDLLEGRLGEALARFQRLLVERREAPAAIPTDTLYLAILELKREAITARDPLARQRETEDASQATEAFLTSVSAEARDGSPWQALWLRGLNVVREGDTVAGWKAIGDLKALSERPGYTEYWEASLTAMTMLKEGDLYGAADQFARASAVSGEVYDLILSGEIRSKTGRHEDARKIFETAEDRLTRHDAGSVRGELILTEPRLAAAIPIFHYAWAKVGYFTGQPAEARLHFNRLLKYYTRPDKEFMPMVSEALARGAKPE